MATAFDTRAQRGNPQLPFIHPDDMANRYALTGRGNCMAPVITDGALIAFDKRETPEPGDLVGIVFTREAAVRHGMPGIVKRLVSRPTFGCVAIIVVEQLNPPRSFSIASTDVLAVHKLIGLAVDRGDGKAMITPLGGAQ
ncbi:hypothetical protein SKP52_15725 [Sphingopyxis fribergensis]|uniref:Uncharacterized protein n=1 Tax=Sphingopyxis fribergensis TaxID=1515612 RepID=A0A0A7PL96_9SPHN|nr:S24 family peptidase [Sphingopyxis fribergensis]AJA10023.1 hypothetical protein SKP52_15725 [Sphingopyxis fribergensis]